MRTRKALLVLLALAVLLSLTGCFIRSKGVISTYKYDSFSKYSVGNASVDPSKVKDIEIDWISGSVKVVYGKTRTIEIAETANSGKISEDEQLRWMVDGDKLRIKFMKSGFKLINDLNKSLVVTIPEGMAFDEIEIDTVSSDSVISVRAKSYEISNVSGDVAVTTDQVDEFEMKTVSGDAELSFGVCPSRLNMDSVSGSCFLRIPADSGFEAKFSSVSGKINSSIPATFSDDRLQAGDGDASFSFNSVSGDFRIESI